MASKSSLQRGSLIVIFLIHRDAWAGTFEDVLLQRKSPRTDCPSILPTPSAPMKLTGAQESQQLMNDLQKNLAAAATALNGNELPRLDEMTESEGVGDLVALS